MTPYYEADGITLYNCDCRELSAPVCDMVLADPPYGETSLEWDRWPEGWVAALGDSVKSMWCFGSMRMFLRWSGEFAAAGWQMSQDCVWEKQNGSGFHADRFKRVHEAVTHWYRGEWKSVYHVPVTTPDAIKRQVRSKRRPSHMGNIGASAFESHDGGPRLMRSVMFAANCHGYATHPTQKPTAILEPLITYACPPGGVVYAPFAGVGSELETARYLGRKAIGCEVSERYCETIAKRLSGSMPLVMV